MDGMPWHVLHVLSNQERRVARHLEVRSVEYYLPSYSERVRWSDRTVWTQRVLFPGYVFTRHLPHQRVTVIAVPGVLQDLGDEVRNMVSDAELEKIRAGLTSGLLLRPHRNITVGTRVIVREGIFMGAEGTVLELRKRCMVVLSLPAVRQSFSLDVDAGSLEILKAPVIHSTGWGISTYAG